MNRRILFVLLAAGAALMLASHAEAGLLKKCCATCGPKACEPVTCAPKTCEPADVCCKPRLIDRIRAHRAFRKACRCAATCEPKTCEPKACEPVTCAPKTCEPADVCCKPRLIDRIRARRACRKACRCAVTCCPATCEPAAPTPAQPAPAAPAPKPAA